MLRPMAPGSAAMLDLFWSAANTPLSQDASFNRTMSFRADLALYDRDGRLTAVAEVKNRLGTSRRWAAQTRRNILAHGSLGQSDYFLLVTPDRIYLWKDAGAEPDEVLPNYEGNLEPSFAPYFDKARIDPGRVTGQAFEMLVAAWLSDLTRASSGDPDSGQDWLEESGLRAAARDGHVEHEAVV